MKVRPGASVVCTLTEAPTGLEGTLEVGLLSLPTEAFVVPSSAVGVTEISNSGTYYKTFVAPDEEGTYLDVWTDGATTVTGQEPIEVMFNAPSVVAVDIDESYATLADLEAYLEDGLPNGFDESYLEKVLIQASEDIDAYATGYAGLGFTRKFYSEATPAWWDELEDRQTQAFVEATCAQAEWRLAKGDQYFVEAGVTIGPKATMALGRVGLRLVGKFATAR